MSRYQEYTPKKMLCRTCYKGYIVDGKCQNPSCDTEINMLTGLPKGWNNGK